MALMEIEEALVELKQQQLLAIDNIRVPKIQ